MTSKNGISKTQDRSPGSECRQKKAARGKSLEMMISNGERMTSESDSNGKDMTKN
jgi:hypothetical protein